MIQRFFSTIASKLNKTKIMASSIAAEATLLSGKVPKSSKEQIKKDVKGSTKQEQFSLKTPKGTKDWADKDMLLREKIFDSLLSLFKRHGGVTIDTPVFELREILTGKYGEDSKLIYNLEDQGGELTSLRYDLTVPFARFVAMNNVNNIKRYHIAKVYRRDQPAMTKGRMREFYQCDFDVAGSYDPMVPDSEMLNIVCEGLRSLGINDFKIKVNHRKILDGIFQACGVKDEDVRKVSSAVDKLDKTPWEAVKKEMVEEKAQPVEVADKIGMFVKYKGSVREVLNILEHEDLLKQNEFSQTGIKDMHILADYVEAFDISDYVIFDLSLARGLDYYTGLIYEAITLGSAPPKNAHELKQKSKESNEEAEDASEYVGVGSIAAGGRYDNLVSMFSPGKSIPCVGISFGVERIFSIVKARIQRELEKLSPSQTQAFVMAFGGGEGWDGFLKERMLIANKLWKAGINCEFLYKSKANVRKQFEASEKSGAQIGVILGKEEFPQGKVRVKVLGQGEANDQGELIDIDNLVPFTEAKLKETNHEGLDQITRLIKGFNL